MTEYEVVNVRTTDDVQVVRLCGEVDLTNAIEVRDAINDIASPDATTITIDLTPTTYLDSSGIAILFHLAERLNDRRQHVEELITPSLAAGKVVILDRYYFSTMAYQGARGFDPAEIRRLNEAFAPVPDLLLIMDLDVDSALERIGVRGDTANEFEKRENLERCREIFLSLRNEPFARVIDTRGTLDEVAAQVRAAAGHLVQS